MAARAATGAHPSVCLGSAHRVARCTWSRSRLGLPARALEPSPRSGARSGARDGDRDLYLGRGVRADCVASVGRRPARLAVHRSHFDAPARVLRSPRDGLQACGAFLRVPDRPRARTGVRARGRGRPTRNGGLRCAGGGRVPRGVRHLAGARCQRRARCCRRRPRGCDSGVDRGLHARRQVRNPLCGPHRLSRARDGSDGARIAAARGSAPRRVADVSVPRFDPFRRSPASCRSPPTCSYSLLFSVRRRRRLQQCARRAS